jgi:hypothetical protein
MSTLTLAELMSARTRRGGVTSPRARCQAYARDGSVRGRSHIHVAYEARNPVVTKVVFVALSDGALPALWPAFSALW